MRRWSPGGPGLFFKVGDSRLVVLVMAGPRGELPIAQRAQFAAQDLFGDSQALFVEHPSRQIDQPPTHDLMNGGDGTGFDHGHEP